MHLDSLTIWRMPASAGGAKLRCVVSMIGEEWFELRLVCGARILLAEAFTRIDRLIDRAEELRNAPGESDR